MREYLDIVEKIDSEVNRVVSDSRTDEENDAAVLGVVQNHILSFKVVLEGVGPAGMDRFCKQYQGFRHFSEFMERFARATADGAFKNIQA